MGKEWRKYQYVINTKKHSHFVNTEWVKDEDNKQKDRSKYPYGMGKEWEW